MIVKFEGRLGNQLFQYAFAYALAKEYPDFCVEFDRSTLNNRYFQIDKAFRLDIPFCNTQDNFIQKRGEIVNLINDKNFTSKVINENSYFAGFWQSERYFSKYKNEILNVLEFNKVNDFRNKQYIRLIKNNFSVSIHVRRTDYFNPENKDYYLDLSSTDYYKNSISLVQSEYPDAIFFVFSDNIRECKKLFRGKCFVFVNCNSRHPWKDMFLMTLCDRNIVANSSFSWWGAYLNPRKDVIAPKDNQSGFARDYPFYYPDSWKKVEI